MTCDICMSRREFLGKSTIAISTLAIAIPLSATLASCGNDASPATANAFTFAANPALKNSGGTMLATLQTPNGPQEVYLTRLSDDTAIAVSTKCTHRGIQLKPYDSATNQYACPAHGSLFNADGTIVKGPAKTPLPTYKTKITETGIEVVV